MARRPTLKSLAYVAIRDAILSGSLPSGTPISEPRLQEMLGIGRTPIREALDQLAGENLVSLVPHKGAVVSGISVEDCWDVFLVREALEGLAAALAAQRIPPQQSQTLMAECQAFHRRLDDLELADFAAFGARLHRSIQEGARSPRLSQLLSTMQQQIARLGDYQLGAGGRARESFREHEAITAAIVARDPVAAERAMRFHVRRSAETAVSMLVGADRHAAAGGSAFGAGAVPAVAVSRWEECVPLGEGVEAEVDQACHCGVASTSLGPGTG